jgi:hypothetical protein
VLFDAFGALKKFESVEEIIKEYYDVRLKCYVKRKEFLEGMLAAEAERLTAQARFILEKIDGSIVVGMFLYQSVKRTKNAKFKHCSCCIIMSAGWATPSKSISVKKQPTFYSLPKRCSAHSVAENFKFCFVFYSWCERTTK